MIGKTILHYEIVEKLGSGGMGVVFKALDTKLQRFVALKFLPQNFAASAEDKERFYREARTASRLDHPNICNIHALEETPDGQILIAMAYYEGQSLRRKMADRLLETGEIFDIIRQVCRGLDAAHQAGIVHRDIKPENILVTPDGTAKIVDFGLAKRQSDARLTQSGSTVGTLYYMAPEQIQAVEADARSDTWAVGVLLYELLLGAQPFSGEYAQVIMYEITSTEPDFDGPGKDRLTPALQAILGKALEKKPEERYQTCAELLADIEGRTHLPASMEKRSTRTSTSPFSSARALKPWAVLIAAGLLLAAILIGFFLQDRTASETPLRKSIAVLPFKSLSPDANNAYFSDGVAEDLLVQLSKIGDLRVMSRRAVIQYKDSPKSYAQIGKELSVGSILEGSVRREDNRVRIVANLVDAKTGVILWSSTYDTSLTHIFEIQGEVATQIANALQAQLSALAREQINTPPTKNQIAYTYYLRGRGLYYQYQKEANAQAIDYFKRAIARDPNYALAYAGLADCYSQQWIRFGYSYAWIDSAFAMSRKALEINPVLAEAHKAVGLAYLARGWLSAGKEANERAIELSPNFADAIGNLGTILTSRGELDQAYVWLSRALALDPTLAVGQNWIGYIYLLLEQQDLATYYLNQARSNNPRFVSTYCNFALLSVALGEGDKARAFIDTALSIDPNSKFALSAAGFVALTGQNLQDALLYFRKASAIDPVGSSNPAGGAYYGGNQIAYAYCLSRAGQEDESLRLRQEARALYLSDIEAGNEKGHLHYGLAALSAIENDAPAALDWLRQAADTGWRDVRLAEIDPLLSSIRHFPEFQNIIARTRALNRAYLQNMNGGVDGLLGLNFLRHFDTEIKYSDNTLTLTPLLSF